MHVRKHLTGGFPCAVMDLSGNLLPLLIPEYSGIKRRGTPFRGWGIQAFPLVVSHYGDKYPLLSLIGIALCFVKSGILTFIFAENNYSWLKHLCSIRALVPLSFFLFLSFSYLSISGWFPGMRAGCVTQGIIASLLLSLQTTSFRPIKGPTHACMLSHFNRVQLFWDPMDCSPPGSSVHGILQATVLKWAAMPSSKETSRPRDRTCVFRITGRFFYCWATREAHKTQYSQVN